jgi:integrase
MRRRFLALIPSKYRLYLISNMPKTALKSPDSSSKLPKNAAKTVKTVHLGPVSPKKNDKVKKRSEKLPKYVVVKGEDWYVRRLFPSGKRDAKGRVVYIEIKKKCEPKTPEKADSLARGIVAAVKEAKIGDPAGADTVVGYIQKYLGANRAAVARRTYEASVACLNLHFKETAFGQRPIREIKTGDVQDFYNSLTDRTPSVIRKIHLLLSATCNLAVTWDDLPKNPCKGVRLPKINPHELKAFDEVQAKAFIAECQKTDENIVFEFALETGMRPGEYLALTWKDIDLKKRTARVNKAVAYYIKGGGYEIKEPKTKGSRRTVDFSENMQDRLLAQQIRLTDYKKLLTRKLRQPVKISDKKGANYQRRKTARAVAREILDNLETLDLVFPSEKGLPKSPNNINRREFKAIVQAINLKGEDFSIYCLRHTMISLSLAAGANIKAIAEKAGIAVETMLTNYAHVFPTMKVEATAKLAGVLY